MKGIYKTIYLISQALNFKMSHYQKFAIMLNAFPSPGVSKNRKNYDSGSLSGSNPAIGISFIHLPAYKPEFI